MRMTPASRRWTIIAVAKALMLATALAFAAAGSRAETLATPSYRISIAGCKEYVVSCDNVKYVGVSRKTGRSISLTGRTVHTIGPDGVTPSRFLGYEFRNGGTTYFVGENGSLRVTRGSKVLVEEQGKWE